MPRLKTFSKYLLWIILFFIFSQLMIYVALNTTYRYKAVESKTPLITQAEVQATSVDGFAKCKILNNTQTYIENKYIKIDCYSKNSVLMGTKYIKIDKIATNEEKEYEVRFNFNKVDNVTMQIIDNIPQTATEEQKVSDPKMNAAMLISALILLITFG